ncbi:MAG: aminomethyl-transferring glycine dehydrogenase subunit GcvPB [Spirochaetota bacterium]|nr:aminomethyl-transferring glycine dehydrogenase subunit GcvPB [Spirochaetota bacterium]
MRESVFQKSVAGRRGFQFPELDVEESDTPSWILRQDGNGMPSLSELDVIRHYTNLSRLNFSVDTHFYPLGSCTMKYNPKINEQIAGLDGFVNIHPYQPEIQVQGALEAIYELERILGEVSGFPHVSLSPSAGAQGEYAGVMVIKKYFESKNETRSVVIIPDSAHGTNPASAAMAGFKIKTVKSNESGMVDVEHLKSLLNKDVACIMLTNPNTLGLFEKDILEISALLKANGSLLYYDGANLNAIVGKVRPADMGFDVMHINLHKTFSTPHGGGGPGCGPVLVSDELKEFLPYPRVVKQPVEKNPAGVEKPEYVVEDRKEASIGRIRWFYGNFLVILKAYTYALTLGRDGLEKVSERAVLNANYLKERLKKTFHLPYDSICMHEFVLSLKSLKSQHGVSALDVAKRLIDAGIHPPTMYFPLIVPEAMMIEPTETESKETLDAFLTVMEEIYKESVSQKENVTGAPFNMPVRRLDEVKAVKEPRLTL